MPCSWGASTPATPLILPGSNYHRGWLGPRCAGFDSPYGKPRASVAAASAPATTASSRRHLYRSRWPSPPQRGSVIGGSHFATTLCSEFCCYQGRAGLFFSSLSNKWPWWDLNPVSGWQKSSSGPQDGPNVGVLSTKKIPRNRSRCARVACDQWRPNPVSRCGGGGELHWHCSL
jgi:hypothetical protein